LQVDSICIDDGAVELRGGIPVGGAYTGVEISNNLFDPLIAGIGTHIIHYEFEDANGCMNSASDEIIVIEEGCVSNVRILGKPSVIDIVPNPTTGNVSIKLNRAFNNKELILKLYNSNGQLTFFRKGCFSDLIEIRDLAKGVYYMLLTDEEDSVSEKIIVQ